MNNDRIFVINMCFYCLFQACEMIICDHGYVDLHKPWDGAEELMVPVSVS